jgi:hypothetical protein
VGYKSRSGWVVPVCCKYDCVNRDTDVCKDCIPRFDYKKADKECIVQKSKKNIDTEKV